MSLCSGAFVLGAAGILDGRRCTTHWMYTDALVDTHPAAKVETDALFVEDGNVITSAGTAAGIDACLHLVRRELGTGTANKIARRMVVPPQRAGSVRQYVEAPIPDISADTLEPILTWALEHLDHELSVRTLAARAHMSQRTFARRFVEETGDTPLQWILHQRVLHARRLLENSPFSVEEVASRCGFGTAAALRRHFSRVLGTVAHELPAHVQRVGLTHRTQHRRDHDPGYDEAPPRALSVGLCRVLWAAGQADFSRRCLRSRGTSVG